MLKQWPDTGIRALRESAFAEAFANGCYVLVEQNFGVAFIERLADNERRQAKQNDARRNKEGNIENFT